MKSLPKPKPSALPSLLAAADAWHAQLDLQPLEPVQTLACPAGQTAVLQVLKGCVWITCDGCEEDYFLVADERLEVPGPATLRASADGPQPARLAWQCAPFTATTAATAAATATAKTALAAEKGSRAVAHPAHTAAIVRAAA